MRYCPVSPPALTVRLSRGSVDGHPLPIDQLKGTTPTESIDFSEKGLGVASAIIIASCIGGNEHLKQLKCAASAIVPPIPTCSRFECA